MPIKLIAKKTWLWAKKFWWLVVISLGIVVAFLLYLVTRNGAFVATLTSLLDIKRNAYDQEMETLAHIHNTEITEKNARLKEYHSRRSQIEKDHKERGERLSKEKEAELKRIVDESYNNPEKLARELAAAFGIQNG